MKNNRYWKFLILPLCAGVALVHVGAVCVASALYTPPPASKDVLQGVEWAGQPVAPTIVDRFAACDRSDTCNGVAQPPVYQCHSDPNNNSTVLKLKGGTIFFDAKLALDTDGSPYAANHHGTTNQPTTSLTYPVSNLSINADRVPYVVIPSPGFAVNLGIVVGDVAAVVWGPKKVYTVVADTGPPCKIGEGSMALHEALGHPVCTKRSVTKDCEQISDLSIGKNVLYFIFPGTKAKIYPGLTPDNINERIQTVGDAAWKQLVLP